MSLLFSWYYTYSPKGSCAYWKNSSNSWDSTSCKSGEHITLAELKSGTKQVISMPHVFRSREKSCALFPHLNAKHYLIVIPSPVIFLLFLLFSFQWWCQMVFKRDLKCHCLLNQRSLNRRCADKNIVFYPQRQIRQCKWSGDRTLS